MFGDRQKVLDYIKEHDKGQGVEFAKIECGLTKDAVEIVCQELMSEGDIFECRAGFVKVL